MKRASRKSTMAAEIGPIPVGSFSTRFSLPSFVKRVEKLTDDQKIALKKVGFGNLLEMPNMTLNKSLLVELMNRWNCEKLAFVLLSKEITINLMDVALIMGLRVMGKPVVLKEDEPFSDLEEEHGATLGQRKITIVSIERRLDALGGAVSDDFIRSFLLFTFGIFLFPSTTTKVDSRYLSVLRDLDNLCHFAWGAAVLEDISMWLCKRRDNNVQYVGGCLLFLQIWSYEHIDIARPSLPDCCVAFPRACRWGNNKSRQRQSLTTKFTELQENQIIWTLQLTSAESDNDIIKEFLEAQNCGTELPAPEYSSTDSAAFDEGTVRIRSQSMDPHVVESDSELEIQTAREEEEEDKEGDAEQLRGSQDVPEGQIGTLEYPITPPYVSEIYKEQMEHLSTSNDFSTNCTINIDDDPRTRNQKVDEKKIELKKEMDRLRSEIEILRNQDEEGDAEQLRGSQDVPEGQIGTLEYPITPPYVSEIHKEQMEHPSTSNDFSTNCTINIDDDPRTRNQKVDEEKIELKKEMDGLRSEIEILRNQLLSRSLQDDDPRTRNQKVDEEKIELKKEMDRLRSEIELLRNQLLSRPLLEEQNIELKKEVDYLRRENQLLRSAGDNLVDRIEKLFIDEEINSTEET